MAPISLHAAESQNEGTSVATSPLRYKCKVPHDTISEGNSAIGVPRKLGTPMARNLTLVQGYEALDEASHQIKFYHVRRPEVYLARPFGSFFLLYSVHT